MQSLFIYLHLRPPHSSPQNGESLGCQPYAVGLHRRTPVCGSIAQEDQVVSGCYHHPAERVAERDGDNIANEVRQAHMSTAQLADRQKIEVCDAVLEAKGHKGAYG